MSRNPFLEMLTAPEQEIPGTFWATVTETNPLRVKRDAEPVLPVTPQTLVQVWVGDRVLCLRERRQVIVLGRMGGPVIPAPGPNMLPGFPIMNGVRPPGTHEFGVRTGDPSLWLQGNKTGWVWAQVPITEGERYRFSVDVRATVSGTVFYVETRNAGLGGTEGTPFDSWTSWERSASTTGAGGSYPFQNVTQPVTTWRSYWSEATATGSGAVSLKVYANHANGVANETGYQWFRNLSIMHLPQ